MLDKVILFPYYSFLKIRDSHYKKCKNGVALTDVPSICVGNIAVGGTGKTPHVEMILRLLADSREWSRRQIAVLSRGYKRDSSGFQQVTLHGSASMFGDEPLQIKKNFPDTVVAVDRNRVEGCDFLCHPEKLAASLRKNINCWNSDFTAAEFIILDDAFQYRRLKASRNIILVDYNKPLYKDKLLPLGHLRDLPERIREADVIIVTKCPEEMDNWEKTTCAYAYGLNDYQTSTCEGTAPDGKKQLLFFTKIVYGQHRMVYSTSNPRYMYSKKLILVTGIAKDEPLRRHLSDSYKIVSKFSFPDHHKYSRKDMRKIMSAVRAHPTASVATTEKDAQRLLDYNGMPEDLMARLFLIPIKVDFLSENEREIFKDFIIHIGN